METLRSVRAWRMPLVLLVYGLNTAYLAAFASPTIFYFANVVFHMAAGLALAIAFAIRLFRTRPGSFALLCSAVLAAGVAFGLLIMIVGAAGRWRWLLPTHIALSLAGAAPLLVAGAISVLRRGATRERAIVGAACVRAFFPGGPAAGRGNPTRGGGGGAPHPHPHPVR